MELTCQVFTVHKRVPLTISRGTTAQSTNLWLRLATDGVEGWGEADPFSIGSHQQTLASPAADLATLRAELRGYHPWQRQAIADLAVALWDWAGKATGQPCTDVFRYGADPLLPGILG